MVVDRQTFAISGAGIAGLTAALCLAKAGFLIKLFEKTAVPAISGTGIQLSPNGFRILAELGLQDALELIGNAPDFIQVGNGSNGKPLTRFMLGDAIRKRHGAPYVVLHRKDLSKVLENACLENPAIEIHRDASVDDIHHVQNGVEVSVTNKSIFASALIGADGAWSALRNNVPGSETPYFTGRVAWRTVVPKHQFLETQSQNSTGLWLGRDAHLVYYPLRGGETFNVIAITPWVGEQPPQRGWINDPDHNMRKQVFSDWHPPLADIANIAGEWGGWPIYSVSRAGAAAHKSLCLIGDAAHTMVPFGAQGGTAAIEDAAVLAQCCGNHPDNLQRAFGEFNALRKPRIQKVLNLSNNNRRIYHMNWPMSTARNLIMRITPQEAMQRRMDWLYGWK